MISTRCSNEKMGITEGGGPKYLMTSLSSLLGMWRLTGDDDMEMTSAPE